MRGWFKLIETILKTDSTSTSSNELAKSSSNSNAATSTNVNSHVSKSQEIVSPSVKPFDSTSSPIINSEVSASVQSPDDIAFVNTQPTTKKKGEF